MKIHKYENHIYSEIYSEMRVTPFVAQIPIYLVPWTEDKNRRNVFRNAGGSICHISIFTNLALQSLVSFRKKRIVKTNLKKRPRGKFVRSKSSLLLINCNLSHFSFDMYVPAVSLITLIGIRLRLLTNSLEWWPLRYTHAKRTATWILEPNILIIPGAFL